MWASNSPESWRWEDNASRLYGCSMRPALHSTSLVAQTVSHRSRPCATRSETARSEIQVTEKPHDVSFVQALDIARDHRLVGLRSGDTPEITGPRRGGTESASGSAEGPLAISDKMRAAVNAGSLVSFAAGLNAEEKGDVLYSTQLAQRAASAKHDRFAATRDWYGVYVDVLERLGWVGESFAFTDRGSSAGEFSMDKSALEVIATIATSNQLAILWCALTIRCGALHLSQ
jgi:hypothetical protein